MNSVAALDTNIIIYLMDVDGSRKRQVADELMTQHCIIPLQVITEFLNVTKRLLKKDKHEIMDVCLTAIKGHYIYPAGFETLYLAKTLMLKYDFQLFDSIVVASALEAGCKILYSEDFTNGLIVEESLKIVNPFI